MKRIFLHTPGALLILFVLQINFASAQDNPAINDSIYSNALKEWRSIKIILPENYQTESSEEFEVIYLTDGEWVVNLFPFIYRFAKNEEYVPPAIIVALPNTYINGANQRDRDFLPVHVPSPAISGGADKFLAFLKDELIPYIDKAYRTNGSNSLYGHSYGGVFVMYTIFTEPQLFDIYYATDPPLSWNNDFVIRLASGKLQELPPDKVLWIAGIESTYKNQGIDRMDSVLKLKAPQSLRWKTATFPNEKHNSVRLKAMYDGIKYSYSGYPGGSITFHPMNGIILKDKPATIYLSSDYTHLRYEMDGTEPDETSPKAGSTLILTGPAHLVFKSFSTSGKYDMMAKGNFEQGETLPSLSKPKKIESGGFKYSFYEGTWDKMPDFKKLKPSLTGITDSLFSLKKLTAKADFACLFEGYIEITEDGYYLWAIGSNDGSRLWLGNKLIIDNDGIHTDESFKSYIIPLEKGFYPVRLEYFQKDENHNLQFIYMVPGAGEPRSVPLKYQYHNN
jgi:predicted alpha/beta superfamily hydrolase